jgi:hypothetical protein
MSDDEEGYYEIGLISDDGVSLDMLDPAKRAVPWKIVKHKNLLLPAGHSNRECVVKKF